MSRPAQTQFLTRFAVAYDPVVRFMGFPALWDAVADVAAPIAGERSLDVCTGTGGVALELAQRGARVVGLDLAEGMLRRARLKRNGEAPHRGPAFIQMDAQHLAFPDRSFSLVTCSMGLHEMAAAEAERALAEIARVASDRIVIAEYRVPTDRSRGLLFRLARIYEYLESDDFAYFVGSNLGDRLEQSGLSIDTPRDVGAYRIWPCRTRLQ